MYLCSKNKGAVLAADLQLYFRIYAKSWFSHDPLVHNAAVGKTWCIYMYDDNEEKIIPLFHRNVYCIHVLIIPPPFMPRAV